MRTETRRDALRLATQAAHRSLDELIADFRSLSDYRDYLCGTWLFRTAAEAGVAGDAGVPWRIDRLADHARADLADLDVPTPSDLPATLDANGASGMMGVCYVLEGSALGARLLVRRAAALGMSESFGARHLAMQVRTSRWGEFVTALEGMPGFDIDVAVVAANRTFGMAHDAYREFRR